MNDQAIAVTLLVIDTLELLQVQYVIGGSLASAMHGVARTTLDSDLVADLRLEHVEQFVDQLKGEFYLAAEAMIDAITYRSSFNLIHLETMFKVDIFIPKQRHFDCQQLKNRTAIIVSENPVRIAYLASPEDTILAKLDWYRMGGETSERQWHDVLGVIRVQRRLLNLTYLEQLAAEMNLSDLLEKALHL